MANVEVSIYDRTWWAQAQADADTQFTGKKVTLERPRREPSSITRTQQGWREFDEICGSIEKSLLGFRDKQIRFVGTYEDKEIVFHGELLREDKDARLRTSGLRVKWKKIGSIPEAEIQLRTHNFFTTRLYQLPEAPIAVAERVVIDRSGNATLKLYRRGMSSHTLNQALGRAGLVFFTLGFAYNFYKLYQTYGRNFTEHLDVKPLALNAALGVIDPTGGLVSGALADTLLDHSSSFFQNLTDPVSLLLNGLSFTKLAPALPVIGSLLTLA